jgi:hypothetical protein
VVFTGLIYFSYLRNRMRFVWYHSRTTSCPKRSPRSKNTRLGGGYVRIKHQNQAQTRFKLTNRFMWHYFDIIPSCEITSTHFGAGSSLRSCNTASGIIPLRCSDLEYVNMHRPQPARHLLLATSLLSNRPSDRQILVVKPLRLANMAKRIEHIHARLLAKK